MFFFPDKAITIKIDMRGHYICVAKNISSACLHCCMNKPAVSLVVFKNSCYTAVAAAASAAFAQN